MNFTPPSRFHSLLYDEQEERVLRWSLGFFLLLSLLLHAVLFALLPESLFTAELSEKTQPLRKPITVEYVEAPPERTLPEFVEANPDVPQNEPDPTQQEAARNQQAAQPDPVAQENSPKPQVDGTEADSPKIIDGSLESTTAPALPPGLYTLDEGSGTERQNFAETQTPTPLPAPVSASSPPPDFILQKPESENGPGSTLEEINKATKEPPTDRPRTIQINRTQQVVEVREETVAESVAQEAAARGVPVPQTRPRLHFPVPSGPRMKQPASAGRMGVVAVDAKFSDYGEYQQRMVEAVSQQWHLLADRSNIADGNLKTQVVLRFRMDTEGQIHDLKVVSSTATRPATLLCQDAVLSRAPYGAWTDAMKASLGEDLPMTFTFFYY